MSTKRPVPRPRAHENRKLTSRTGPILWSEFGLSLVAGFKDDFRALGQIVAFNLGLKISHAYPMIWLTLATVILFAQTADSQVDLKPHATSGWNCHQGYRPRPGCHFLVVSHIWKVEFSFSHVSKCDMWMWHDFLVQTSLKLQYLQTSFKLQNFLNKEVSKGQISADQLRMWVTGCGRMMFRKKFFR